MLTEVKRVVVGAYTVPGGYAEGCRVSGKVALTLGRTEVLRKGRGNEEGCRCQPPIYYALLALQGRRLTLEVEIR